jgi:hypothetical protein
MINIIEIYPEINYDYTNQMDYTKHMDYNQNVKKDKSVIIATCEERKDYDKSRELTIK